MPPSSMSTCPAYPYTRVRVMEGCTLGQSRLSATAQCQAEAARSKSDSPAIGSQGRPGGACRLGVGARGSRPTTKVATRRLDFRDCLRE